MSRQPAGSFQGFSTPTPTSQAADFFGHGLSFETVPAVANSEVEQLRSENEQLRQQLQHQQELLLIWQQQPCTLCQLHSTHTSSSSSSSTPASTTSKSRSATTKNLSSSTSSRTSAQLRQKQDSLACRNDSSSGSAADGFSCCPAVQCRLDRALRQQQVQLAQMQRQLMVLQAELSSREQLVLEADTVLAEAARRLAGLATTAAPAPALATSSGSGNTVGNSRGVRTPQPQSAAAVAAAAAAGNTGSRRVVAAARVRTPGSSNSSGGFAGAANYSPSAAGVVTVADQVLEQAQGLATWCRTAASRISRVRAASAAQCRAAREASSCWGGGSSSSSGAAGSRGGWDAGDGQDAAEGVVSRLQQLQLQYVPAGGNKYLAKHTSLPLAGLAAGQGLSLIHLPALQSLMQLLGGLALPLADLAVQLRSIVLPVLPWLGSTAGSVGHVLPESCADLAHSAATAAAEIVELCGVLPAVPGCLSATAAAAASKAAAARAAAEQQASQWGSSSSHANRASQASPGEEETGTACGTSDQRQPCLELDPADQQLLDELAAMLLPAASRQHGSSLKGRDQHSSGRSSGGGGASAVGGAGVSPQRKAGSSNAIQQQQQGDALLHRVMQRWRVLWFKRCVLEEQLGFVARCSAEQTKLVSGLVQRVAAAAAAAADEFETSGELQQRRGEAEQLARQLLRALLLLDQQGGSGSALRALAGLLQQHQDAVKDLPQLLQESSANAVKCAVLAAVAGAFDDFRCELQLAQQSCNTAVASASAAAQV